MVCAHVNCCGQDTICSQSVFVWVCCGAVQALRVPMAGHLGVNSICTLGANLCVRLPAAGVAVLLKSCNALCRLMFIAGRKVYVCADTWRSAVHAEHATMAPCCSWYGQHCCVAFLASGCVRDSSTCFWMLMYVCCFMQLGCEGCRTVAPRQQVAAHFEAEQPGCINRAEFVILSNSSTTLALCMQQYILMLPSLCCWQLYCILC
jgi:hypothetical protein